MGIASVGAGWPLWWWGAPLAVLAGPPGIVFGVGTVAGVARMSSWKARPDPLVELVGTDVMLSGWSDGRTLALDAPAGARVALVPAGEVRTGWVQVRGTLATPPGKRNPGGFDLHGYLKRRGITAQLFWEEVVDARPVRPLRDRLVAAATRGLPPREAALVAAMTFGVRDDLGDLRGIFAAAGLAHVLALSGLHVGVLIGALAWITRGLGPRRDPILLGLLAGFVLLVGPTPSIVRAAGMVGAVLVVRWQGGGRLEPWTAFSLAAVATLVWQPAWLFDVSFQLSYLAVLGLLVFMTPFLRWWRAQRLPWWHPRTLLAGGIGATLSAQLPMGSLLMSQFGEVPLFSPVVNIVGLPLATALVPLGFGAAVAGSIWPPLGHALNLLAQPVAFSLVRLAEIGATWPSLAWGEIAASDHAVYAVAIVALALMAHGRLAWWRAACVALPVLVYALIPPALPEIVVLDVGQGDSVLVRLPGRQEVLIDGGGTPFSDFDPGERIVVPALRALGVDELEIVVATHTDTDHIEGLPAVLRAIPAQHLVAGHPDPQAQTWVDLVTAAEETGADVRLVRRGERWILGNAEFRVLHPETIPIGAANEDSVVLLFVWKGRPVALFPGDISANVERTLAVPQVPLLMVAHHGSRHSTSIELLRAARPDRAVISVGRNRYGHPSAEVLGRLEQYSVGVGVTKSDGALRFSVPDLLHP